MEIEEVGIMVARAYYSVDSQSYKEKKRKILLKELRKKKTSFEIFHYHILSNIFKGLI